MKSFSAAGENLVPISLMSGVPYDAVVRSSKNVVQGYGQFYRTQTRGQVARIVRALINNILAQFFTECRQIFELQLSEIVRRIDVR